MSSHRVLSIQSSVVHGYVGNKAATFPLQLFGFDVDPINTVQFSNHTGYEVFTGSKLTGDQMWELVSGLMKNDLLKYSHLLTGYLGSVSVMKSLIKLIAKLKEHNPNLVFVCDPVMGDDGELYVSEELVGLYRDHVIRHATVLTPNQTEAHFLTGLSITTKNEAFEACCALHKEGVETVVITSLELADSDKIHIIGSTTHGLRDIDSTEDRKTGDEDIQPSEYLVVSVEKFPRYFSGCGDVMSALLLIWLNLNPDDLKGALQKTVSSLHAIIRNTHENKSTELCLIQNRKNLEDPDLVCEIEVVSVPPTNKEIKRRKVA